MVLSVVGGVIRAWKKIYFVSLMKLLFVYFFAFILNCLNIFSLARKIVKVYNYRGDDLTCKIFTFIFHNTIITIFYISNILVTMFHYFFCRNMQIPQNFGNSSRLVLTREISVKEILQSIT